MEPLQVLASPNSLPLLLFLSSLNEWFQHTGDSSIRVDPAAVATQLEISCQTFISSDVRNSRSGFGRNRCVASLKSPTLVRLPISFSRPWRNTNAQAH